MRTEIYIDRTVIEPDRRSPILKEKLEMIFNGQR
jgi:hypothetical protein